MTTPIGISRGCAVLVANDACSGFHRFRCGDLFVERIGYSHRIAFDFDAGLVDRFARRSHVPDEVVLRRRALDRLQKVIRMR